MRLFDKLLAFSDKTYDLVDTNAREQRLAKQAELNVAEANARYEEMTRPAADLIYLDGIPSIPTGMMVNVFADAGNSRIAITAPGGAHRVFIKYSQLCAAGIVHSSDIVTENKSVLGRAAVGGLVLGPVGAIVGGLSGTGQKQSRVMRLFYVLNYHPSAAPHEIAAVKFEIMGAADDVFNLDTALREILPKPEAVEVEEYL